MTMVAGQTAQCLFLRFRNCFNCSSFKEKNAHVPLINWFMSQCEFKQVSMNKFGLRLITFRTEERTCCIISPEKIPLAPIAFA